MDLHCALLQPQPQQGPRRDVLCIPVRYLVTLAILSGGVCSKLLHFPAKTGLETICSSLLNGVMQII